MNKGMKSVLPAYFIPLFFLFCMITVFSYCIDCEKIYCVIMKAF